MKKTNYHLSGTGPCLVLLHGYLEDHRVWLAIAKKIKGYTILIPDMSGSGKDIIPESTDAIEFMADVVHELILSLGFKKYYIAGNSMGGYVAFKLMRKYSACIEKTILISTNPFKDSPAEAKKRMRNIKIIESGKKELIIKVFTNNLNNKTKKLYESMSKNITAENMVSLQKGMMNREDNTRMFLYPVVDTCFMIGSEDKVIPVEKITDLLSGKNKLTLKKIIKGNHFLLTEKSEEVERFMFNALKKNNKTSEEHKQKY